MKKKSRYNQNAIMAAQVAFKKGDWTTSREVSEMTGISHAQASTALKRVREKGDEWFGVGNWQDRIVENPLGGLCVEVMVTSIDNMPDIRAKTKAERAQDELAKNPKLTLNELALIVDCTISTACEARKKFRKNGNKPCKIVVATPKPRKKKIGKPDVNSAIHKDELQGCKMNSMFRQLWPTWRASQ